MEDPMTMNHRDCCTDSSRDGSGRMDRASHMTDIPFHCVTLADEAADAGWNEGTEPVGGEPGPIAVAGTQNG